MHWSNISLRNKFRIKKSAFFNVNLNIHRYSHNMGSLVTAGVVSIITSFTFASIASYYHKKYERSSAESYPISGYNSSDNCGNYSAIVIKREVDKQVLDSKKVNALYNVYNGSNELIYFIQNVETVEQNWFLVDAKKNLLVWILRVSPRACNRKKILIKLSNATSIATSLTNRSGREAELLRYTDTCAQYNEFESLKYDLTDENSAKNGKYKYRWLNNSKYLERLEKIDTTQARGKSGRKKSFKKIASAVNISEQSYLKKMHDYEIIYNEDKIELPTLVLGSFFSIYTQWNHTKRREPVLVSKSVEWNKSNGFNKLNIHICGPSTNSCETVLSEVC